jgi:DNA-binding transcriptional LysR family regulator
VNGASPHIDAAAPARHLRSLGVEPQVEVSVEGFLAVPSLIAGTDRIAFMHERLVQRLPLSVGIRVVPSPLPAIEHVVALHWDASATNDPGHRWFRDVLQRAAAAVGADECE